MLTLTPELAHQTVRLIRKLLAEKSLHEYVKQAWRIVEPDVPFVDNWHIKAICDHLQHLTLKRGERSFDKLLVNVPPGCMKSLITCVFWPTWVWGPHHWPSARWLFAAYDQKLSIRDSVKCRLIMESEWYRDFWGERFSLTGDQNEKMYYMNTRSGWRLATSVGGRGTGEHPDFVVCDDPHSAEQANSDAERQHAIDWWSGTVATRGQTRGVRQVIIMQRLHQKDLSAFVLGHPGWVHICLPMEYEPPTTRVSGETVPRMPATPLGWQDPRTTPGELLWPDLYPLEKVREMGVILNLKAAGQLQQRPTAVSGFMFKREKFGFVEAAPAYEKGDRFGLYWDKAITKDGGCNTAGVVLQVKQSGQVFVVDVAKGQWGLDERNQAIETKSRMMNARVKRLGGSLRVWAEEEGGSGGKESSIYTSRQLQGLAFESDRKGGKSKLSAWEPWASYVNTGNVYLVAGDWNDSFIEEHAAAPLGEFKDQIDAAAGCFNKLMEKKSIDLEAWLNAGAAS